MCRTVETALAWSQDQTLVLRYSTAKGEGAPLSPDGFLGGRDVRFVRGGLEPPTLGDEANEFPVTPPYDPGPGKSTRASRGRIPAVKAEDLGERPARHWPYGRYGGIPLQGVDLSAQLF